MYTIDKYYRNAILISNSLVLKIPEIAYIVNKGIYVKTGKQVNTPKREWLYYQNLAGIKTRFNKDIYIRYLENGEEALLTKERMQNSPLTRRTLLKFGDKFKELVTAYPCEETYIRGCLYDIDLDTIMEAKPGTILAYNKDLLETNEYSLIRELQDYIYNFLARWHVKEYTLTDELYIPSLLAVLYSSIPNKIMNIRNKYSLTAEVNSFHMEHFFRSNMNLWDEAQVLNNPSRYWLYKNLNWMMKHVGKGKTFEKLIWKLLEPNRIGIGGYTLSVPDFDPELLNNTKHTVASYYKPTNVFQTHKLNNAYDVDDKTDVELQYLVRREIDEVDIIQTDATPGRNDYMVEQEAYDVDQSRINQQGTKVLDLNTVRLFQAHNTDPYRLALDYWLYMVSKDKFTYTINYQDANTMITDEDNTNILSTDIDPLAAKTYNITPRVGFLMLLKVILQATGNLDKRLTSIKLSSILNLDPDRHKAIIDGLWDEGRSREIVEEIAKHMPKEPTSFSEVEEFSNYIQELIEYKKYNWYIDTNSESGIVSANIKNFNARVMLPITVKLSNTPKTINQLLAEEGIDYKLPTSFDLNVSFTGLFRQFVGFDLTSTINTEEIIKKYISLVDKLTSYTTQIVTSTAVDEEESIVYNHTTVLANHRPIMTILDAALHPIEHEFTRINSLANDWRDETLSTSLPIPSTMVYKCRRPIRGHMVELKMEDESTYADYFSKPRMAIDVIDIPNVDISRCNFRDEFLSVLKASFKPIENWFTKGRVATTAMTITDNMDSIQLNKPYSIHLPVNSPLVFDNSRKIIRGQAIVAPLEDQQLFADYHMLPQMAADVINIPNIDVSYFGNEQQFLTIKKVRFNPIEDFNSEARLAATAVSITDGENIVELNKAYTITLPVQSPMVFEANKHNSITGQALYMAIDGDDKLFANYNLLPQVVANVKNTPGIDIDTSLLKDEFLVIKKVTFNTLEKYNNDGNPIISTRGVANNILETLDVVVGEFTVNMTNLSNVNEGIKYSTEVNDRLLNKYPVNSPVRYSLGNFTNGDEIEVLAPKELSVYDFTPVVRATDGDADSYTNNVMDITLKDNPDGGYDMITKDDKNGDD